jgi:hypothetical protein
MWFFSFTVFLRRLYTITGSLEFGRLMHSTHCGSAVFPYQMLGSRQAQEPSVVSAACMTKKTIRHWTFTVFFFWIKTRSFFSTNCSEIWCFASFSSYGFHVRVTCWRAVFIIIPFIHTQEMAVSYRREIPVREVRRTEVVCLLGPFSSDLFSLLFLFIFRFLLSVPSVLFWVSLLS